jgi:hypothetical protein
MDNAVHSIAVLKTLIILAALVVLVYAAYFAAKNRQRYQIGQEFKGSEIVYRSTGALHVGGITIGGFCILTKTQLHFTPHKLNLMEKEIAIDISQISQVTVKRRMGLPQTVQVSLQSGKVIAFDVYRGNKWQKIITKLLKTRD